jgi:hypothetical protein
MANTIKKTVTTTTKKEYENKIKDLEEKLSMIMSKLEDNKPKNEERSDDMNRWVKIIHLQQLAPSLTTHVQLSTRVIDFNRFGEERNLRFNEFEEIISKYKSFFDSDILCLSSVDADLADRYELKTEKDNAITSTVLKRISKLPLEELESLYNKCSKGQRVFLINVWCMNYYNNEDPSFRDKKKIDLLNELSNGSIENILLEVSSKTKKK